MKAQFNHLQFEKEELASWLYRMAFVRINLKDKGQDMRKLWIYSTGEILSTDFHPKVYVGMFTDINHIEVNRCLRICANGSEAFVPFESLVIDSIDFINPKQDGGRIEYSPTFIHMIRSFFSETRHSYLWLLAEAGERKLGDYLHDACPASIPIKDIIAATDLEKIKETAQRYKKMIDVYNYWVDHYSLKKPKQQEIKFLNKNQ